MMACSSLLFSLFLISPCTQGGGENISEEVAAAVANPHRPAVDTEKDANRKPAEVLSFFNIQPGMKVFDLFSGSGYYSEILDPLVGKEGKVIAHTNEAYIPFSGEIYKTRYSGGRLAQTETLVSEVDDLELGENSLDAVLMVLIWHDFLFADTENGWAAIDTNLLIDKLCKAVKPGGVIGLIDHAANPGGEPGQVARSLHRVDPQVVRTQFSDSCFKLDAEAKFLRNKADDHELTVFDESVRGKTDRFIFRFVNTKG